MHRKIGYLCFAAAELANLAVLVKAGAIKPFDARVYLAAAELAERRKVAERVRGRATRSNRRAVPKPILPRYSQAELASLLREDDLQRIRRSLRALARIGVLHFESSRIEATRACLSPDDPLCRELRRRGSLSRLVPVPRRLLAELCRESRRSMFLTKLAYILRGLGLDRASGQLRARGCVKASWIAEHFGLSLRAVRLARSRLIEFGFIAKDTGSFQRKLNRDGSYFEIDIGRYAGTLHHCAGRVDDETMKYYADFPDVPAHSTTVPADSFVRPAESDADCDGGPMTESTPSSVRSASEPSPVIPDVRRPAPGFAPRIAQNHREFAPPSERQETPCGSKNQKPEPRMLRASPRDSGARGQQSRSPDLRNIRLDDLRRLSRLRELFRQATSAGWLSRSEADFQNFVAAAVRATRLDPSALRTDPVRVFVGIVRKGLWHHITAEQEERAREVISRSQLRAPANVETRLGSVLNDLVTAVSFDLALKPAA